jgi:hypothetical protein
MKLSDSNKDMISSLIILGGVVAFLIWYFTRDKKESSYAKPKSTKDYGTSGAGAGTVKKIRSN